MESTATIQLGPRANFDLDQGVESTASTVTTRTFSATQPVFDEDKREGEKCDARRLSRTKAERKCLAEVAVATAKKNPEFQSAINRMSNKSEAANFSTGLKTALQLLTNQVFNAEQQMNPAVQAITKSLDTLPTCNSSSQDFANYGLAATRHINKALSDYQNGVLEQRKALLLNQHETGKNSSKFKSHQAALTRLRLQKREIKARERSRIQETVQFCEALMTARLSRLNAFLQLTDAELDERPAVAVVAKSKKKKNAKKNIAPTVALHVSGEDTISAPKETPQPLTLDQQRNIWLNECFKGSVPPLHPRVLRWRTRDHDKVRLFTDGSGASFKYSYKDCTDEELPQIIRDHASDGTEHLIGQRSHAFQTRTGCGMICRTINHKNNTTRYGTLYFGLDREHHNRVYHRYFEAQEDSVTDEVILKGPKLDPRSTEATDSGKEEKWELAGNYAKSISPDGVIRFFYPRDEYSLFIYPVRRDLLKSGLFEVE